jgi:hypothetical protein
MRKLIAIIFSICLVIPLLLPARSHLWNHPFGFWSNSFIPRIDDEMDIKRILSLCADGILRRQLALRRCGYQRPADKVCKAFRRRIFISQNSAIVSDFFDYSPRKTDQFKRSIRFADGYNQPLTSEKQFGILTALVRLCRLARPDKSRFGERIKARETAGIDDATY